MIRAGTPTEILEVRGGFEKVVAGGTLAAPWSRLTPGWWRGMNVEGKRETMKLHCLLLGSFGKWGGSHLNCPVHSPLFEYHFYLCWRQSVSPLLHVQTKYFLWWRMMITICFPHSDAWANKNMVSHKLKKYWSRKPEQNKNCWSQTLDVFFPSHYNAQTFT
jgi:hypothetical protein